MKYLKQIIYETFFNVNERITPENISELKPNEVFVFGSNTGGFHGAGAAALALKWGAEYKNGFGRQGQTYAIPTKEVKDRGLITMSTRKIEPYINEFIEYAKNNPECIFLVTQIGCGLAGYKPHQIAPFFRKAKNIKNIYLPKCFWEII